MCSCFRYDKLASKTSILIIHSFVKFSGFSCSENIQHAFLFNVELPVFEPGRDVEMDIPDDGKAVIHDWPLHTNDITYVVVDSCLTKATGVCVSTNVTDLQPPVTVNLPQGEGGYTLKFTLYDGEDVVLQTQYSPGGM